MNLFGIDIVCSSEEHNENLFSYRKKRRNKHYLIQEETSLQLEL